ASAGADGVRVALVRLAEGADAVVRKELALVEDIAEDALQAVPRRDAQEVALAPLDVADGDAACQVLLVLEEPVHALAEAGKVVDGLGVERAAGEEGYEANDAPDADRRGLVRDLIVELVVIEAVHVVPQAGAAQRVHGVGDGGEVLEELAGAVLVAPVVAGQLEGDAQHHHAVEGHPRGSVGLLQVPAVGRADAAVEDADVVEPEKAAAEDVAAARSL